MAKIPSSTQTSLWQRLTSHASQRWPQISRINTRYRAGFAYIAAVVDEETIRLCRLRYGGSAHQWGFAIYRASHDDYEDSYRPTGYPVGTCEEAPRHRLRALPQRPHRLDLTPDELTGATTSAARTSVRKYSLERARPSPRWADCERGHDRAQPNARVHSGHCQDDKQE